MPVYERSKNCYALQRSLLAVLAVLMFRNISIRKKNADRLNMSQRTVETHMNNIFRKLEINSTSELVELMKQKP